MLLVTWAKHVTETPRAVAKAYSAAASISTARTPREAAAAIADACLAVRCVRCPRRAAVHRRAGTRRELVADGGFDAVDQFGVRCRHEVVRPRRKIVETGPLVAQCPVDQHDVGRLPEVGDLPGRRDADEEAAAGCEQLLGHQHRERRADGVAQDADGRPVRQLQLVEFRVVAGPSGAEAGAATQPGVAEQVPIRVEHADGGNVPVRQVSLPPGLTQQMFWTEHGRLGVVLYTFASALVVAQDGIPSAVPLVDWDLLPNLR